MLMEDSYIGKNGVNRMKSSKEADFPSARQLVRNTRISIFGAHDGVIRREELKLNYLIDISQRSPHRVWNSHRLFELA